MGYFIVAYRTLFFYTLIVFLYRIMGKREIGELGVMDLIVSISIAQLAAISIENHRDPLLMVLIPILIMFGLQLLVSILSLKNTKFKNTLDGKPTFIIRNGKIDFKGMVREKYNIKDLLTQLRGQGVKSIEEVEYAVLETNGKLSVFKYNLLKIPSNYPMAIILAGEVQTDTLKALNKSEYWLQKKLDQAKITLDEVFYAFNKGNKLYIIKKEK